MAEGDAPKIQIDSDWKAQAQAEKQKLAQQSQAAAASGGQTGAGDQSQQAPGGMPPATFETLMSTMATQALFAMGAIPDPRTGQRMAHLDLARHHIDMLTVLEEKTKGNLTQEESDTLAATVYELRNRYVQLAASARSAASAPAAGSAPGSAPGNAGTRGTPGTGGPGGIIGGV